jgi:hypothetical protein
MQQEEHTLNQVACTQTFNISPIGRTFISLSKPVKMEQVKQFNQILDIWSNKNRYEFFKFYFEIPSNKWLFRDLHAALANEDAVLQKILGNIKESMDAVYAEDKVNYLSLIAHELPKDYIDARGISCSKELYAKARKFKLNLAENLKQKYNLKRQVIKEKLMMKTCKCSRTKERCESLHELLMNLRQTIKTGYPIAMNHHRQILANNPQIYFHAGNNFATQSNISQYHPHTDQTHQIANKRQKSTPAEAKEGSEFRFKSEDNSYIQQHPRNSVISNSNYSSVSTIQIDLISKSSMNSNEQDNLCMQSKSNTKSINQSHMQIVEDPPNIAYKDSSYAQKIFENNINTQNSE